MNATHADRYPVRTHPAGFAPVGALGLGCWAIGGPLYRDGISCGYAHYDDTASLQAVARALDLGITLFDTADLYGAGHSERLLGQALRRHRHEVVITTKFGNTFDEASRQWTGERWDDGYVRAACEASLRRLQTDYLDVYFLHLWDFAEDGIEALQETLESLVAAGKIRAYGWSTDRPAALRRFAAGAHNRAIQHNLNVLEDDPGILPLTDEADLLSLIRTPLAMGLLSGKYDATSARFSDDDVRGKSPDWLQYFKDGRANPEFLARLDAIREVLRSDGRTLAQGALAWIWARHPRPVPIVGFRSVAQVEENAAALAKGPLTPDEMAEIDRLLGREREAAAVR